MNLLDQILQFDRATAEPVFVDVVSEGTFSPITPASPGRLYESAVAYVEDRDEPNALLLLARGFDRPEGYGDYSVAESERADDDEPDEFPIEFERDEA